MFKKFLKSKLQGLVVTEKKLKYNGSIQLDEEFLKMADILPYEEVLVINLSSGERFETYVIPAKKGSRKACVMGGAARLVEVGDELIIMSFVYLQYGEKYSPTILLFDKKNKIKLVKKR